jgi:mono/diheme cytochrome c family protein
MLGALWAVVLLAGCQRALWEPPPWEPPKRPDEVTDPNFLYAQNCTACHGVYGKLGPGPPLNHPLFLAIVTDDQLRKVISEGRPGTMMPAFSTTKQGRVLAPNLQVPPNQQDQAPEHAKQLAGPLTTEQVEILVQGIRRHGQQDPSLSKYTSLLDPETTGDAKAGKEVYARACSNCHGDNGQGITGYAGALNDPAFLALISDQEIRRIAFTGRPDLNMPSYREGAGTVRPLDFQPLTPQEIADVAAWVVSWRTPTTQLAEKKD